MQKKLVVYFLLGRKKSSNMKKNKEIAINIK
jgi:hypothetical protein